METAEKAKELIEKYIQFTPVEFEYEYAKKCALIAVDEIMKIERLFTNNRTCKFEGYGYTSSIEYWQAVKAELILNK